MKKHETTDVLYKETEGKPGMDRVGAKLALRKAGRITGFVLLGIVILAFVVFALMHTTYIPRGYDVDLHQGASYANPHIVKETPAEGTYATLVSAHRAGKTLAPENTMAAFIKCFESAEEGGYVIDTLEFDLHLTGDGELVLLHDDTLDRTSDCVDVYGEKEVYPHNKTLEELRIYNMGYHFQDPVTGEYSYRDAVGAVLDSVRVSTLVEVLDLVKGYLKPGQSMNYIIEIKDSGERGKEATDKLYETMLDYGILDNVIVGTFNADITAYIGEKYQNREDGKNIIRSASITEVIGFYFAFMFDVDLTKKDLGYSVLQIPYIHFALNMGIKNCIDYAHKNGLAVQFWTINDAEEMLELSKNGADTIMTDDPELLYNTIKVPGTK